LDARRIEDRALARSIRAGNMRVATAAETHASPRMVGALGGSWIDRIAEIQRVERLDVYENQAILGFVQWLVVTLSTIKESLTRDLELPLDQAACWLSRIALWQQRLELIRRQPAFVDLLPDPILR